MKISINKEGHPFASQFPSSHKYKYMTHYENIIKFLRETLSLPCVFT